MSEEYCIRYSKLIEGLLVDDIQFRYPERFYNGYRRAVNRAGTEYYSNKVESVLPILLQGHSVIYTNWIEFGIRPITDALHKHNVSYSLFFGDVSLEERARILDDFNNGLVDILIITRAGGEGIDLRGVRNIIVLDPTWDTAALEQVVGRAIRFRSHAHLPEDERNVNVYFARLLYPKDKGPCEQIVGHVLPKSSGDEILYDIIQRKNKVHDAVIELLRILSI